MSERDRAALLAALAGDVDDAARALHGLHRFEIADPASFRAVLAAIRDERPLPEAFQPAVEVDPFAGFFGATGGGAPKKTLGDLAAQKLGEVGWPGLLPIAEAAAAELAAAPTEALAQHCADRLGDTEWEDRLGALRILAPALHAADAALYPVIVRQDDEGVDVLVASALAPYRSRAVNELLANGNSHHAMLTALVNAVVSGTLQPDDQQAMGVLAQLVTWSPEQAPKAAAALEARYPWAVTFAAFDDAAARDRMTAWLATAPSYPGSLPLRLDEALRSRAPIEGYPLVAWLRACDGAPDVIAAWKCAASAADLLQAWVNAADLDRAVQSALLLAAESLHAPVAERVVALVADPDAPWTPEGLRTVAALRPTLPGVDRALAAVLARDPSAAAHVVPALLAAEPSEDALRAAAIAAIEHAEAAPVKHTKMRRGGTRTEREGTDTPALKPLVEALGDPALAERLDAVLPYLGA